MPNTVKKLSISSELAQKMVNAAVAKARELGVAENVAILDDGGNVKAFSRMDGAPIPSKWRRAKRTQLCSASLPKISSNLSRATRRSWPAYPLSSALRRGVDGFPSR